jgi:hypothetical protein
MELCEPFARASGQRPALGPAPRCARSPRGRARAARQFKSMIKDRNSKIYKKTALIKAADPDVCEVEYGAWPLRMLAAVPLRACQLAPSAQRTSSPDSAPRKRAPVSTPCVTGRRAAPKSLSLTLDCTQAPPPPPPPPPPPEPVVEPEVAGCQAADQSRTRVLSHPVHSLSRRSRRRHRRRSRSKRRHRRRRRQASPCMHACLAASPPLTQRVTLLARRQRRPRPVARTAPP